MYWLIVNKPVISSVPVQNKILLLKQVMKPISTYTIQLCGCASKTHINKVLDFQKWVLKTSRMPCGIYGVFILVVI